MPMQAIIVQKGGNFETVDIITNVFIIKSFMDKGKCQGNLTNMSKYLQSLKIFDMMPKEESNSLFQS